MFTGIVEETGLVKAIRRCSNEAKIIISCSTVLGRSNSLGGKSQSFTPPTEIGDSIAVNGVCLTVTDIDSSTFTADIMPETFKMSALAELRSGSKVNLERAMAANGRFGGHIVSGHIDGTGKILSITQDINAIWFKIGADPNLCRYIVTKGSIAIDGISLTVAEAENTCFKVSIIPHTLSETTLSNKKTGELVNLETDIIGKYVEKLFGGHNEKQRVQI